MKKQLEFEVESGSFVSLFEMATASTAVAATDEEARGGAESDGDLLKENKE